MIMIFLWITCSLNDIGKIDRLDRLKKTFLQLYKSVHGQQQTATISH